MFGNFLDRHRRRRAEVARRRARGPTPRVHRRADPGKGSRPAVAGRCRLDHGAAGQRARRRPRPHRRHPRSLAAAAGRRGRRRLVLNVTSEAGSTGASCTWTEAAAVRLTCRNGSDLRHLIRDARVAEEIAIHGAEVPTLEGVVRRRAGAVPRGRRNPLARDGYVCGCAAHAIIRMMSSVPLRYIRSVRNRAGCMSSGL